MTQKFQILIKMKETENTTATINVEASAMIENMKRVLIDTAETYGTESQEWLNAIKFTNRVLGDEAYKELCAQMNAQINGKYKLENASLRERRLWMDSRLSELHEHIRNVAYDLNDLDRAISVEFAIKVNKMTEENSKIEREFLSYEIARLTDASLRYSTKANALRTCKDILNS